MLPRPLVLICSLSCALAVGCSGPPMATPIAGEPTCPDFELGATRTPMRGGLRIPVAVTILDGSEPVTRVTILGKRNDQDPPTRVLLADADGEYTVEWAQCDNERAPRPIAAGGPKGKSTAAPRGEAPAEYECGKGTVYKTEKLTTKKGDAASHDLTFPPPPKAECWVGVAAVEPAADAGAPDAPAGPAADDAGAAAAGDAGAEGGDAGKASDAGLTPDAPAPRATSDAGAKPAAADAGVKKPKPPE